jgi:hypothetical protein
MDHVGRQSHRVELMAQVIELPQLTHGVVAVLVAQAVGHGEMGPQSTEVQLRVIGNGLEQRRHLGGWGSDAVHPGVHLDLDGGGAAEGAGGP